MAAIRSRRFPSTQSDDDVDVLFRRAELAIHDSLRCQRQFSELIVMLQAAEDDGILRRAAHRLRRLGWA